MKKIILAMCACACVFAFMPRTAQAVDVSVGATMWVSEWDPFFKKSMGDGASVKMDPGLVAGPVLSFRFANGLSWSNVLLAGKFDGKINSSYSYDDGTGHIINYSSSVKMETWRSDLDSTLNYSFNKYFKIFGGMKAMYMSYTMKQTGDSSPTTNGIATGPAAGIGLSFPLTDSLFALCNFSGIYMRGMMHTGGTSSNTYTNTFGVNSTASLAYYVADWGTTFSIGGRYQQLRYYFSSSNYGNDGSDDKFYGLVLSALYSF